MFHYTDLICEFEAKFMSVFDKTNQKLIISYFLMIRLCDVYKDMIFISILFSLSEVFYLLIFQECRWGNQVF